MAEIWVALNGTDTNPFHKHGLSFNPFPQIAKYETLALVMNMQKLGGDPIPNVQYIRDTLKGCEPEFIELCCRMYKKGEMVKFKVQFPDE